jgi:hypothetical protein
MKLPRPGCNGRRPNEAACHGGQAMISIAVLVVLVAVFAAEIAWLMFDG